MTVTEALRSVTAGVASGVELVVHVAPGSGEPTARIRCLHRRLVRRYAGGWRLTILVVAPRGRTRRRLRGLARRLPEVTAMFVDEPLIGPARWEVFAGRHGGVVAFVDLDALDDPVELLAQLDGVFAGEDPAWAAPTRWSRRRALAGLGGAGLGLVALAACGSGKDKAASASTEPAVRGTSSSTVAAATSPSVATTSAASPTAASSVPATGAGASPPVVAAPSCVLAPELTEGPYYLDLELVRTDITEGKPGTPFTVELTIVDAANCRPLKDVAVDIWHCDAAGAYSGFAGGGGGQGTTFLRGTQISDATGKVRFQTIYPGWYRGRAVHIHVMAHAGRKNHTGQVFMEDAVSAKIYAAAPYAARGVPDQPNSQDGIYRESGGKSNLVVTENGSGYRGSLVFGVAV